MSLKSRIAFNISAQFDKPLTARELDIIAKTCDNFAAEIIKQTGFTMSEDNEQYSDQKPRVLVH